MPYIRVNCLEGALTPPKKAKLAAALVEIVMGQEIEPMTDIGRAATPVMFSEIDAHNWFFRRSAVGRASREGILYRRSGRRCVLF